MLTLPGEHGDIVVAGIRVRYVEAGRGSPVVLLHGLASSKAVWWNNIGPLARSHRVIALDLPGHGDSEKPQIAYDAESMIEFMRGFIEALGLQRAALIGGSLGGGLALHTAFAHPDLVSALVLTGSAALGREIAGVIRLASLPRVGEFMMSGTVDNTRVMLRRIMFDQSLVSAELLGELQRTNHMPGASEAALMIVRNFVGIWGVRRKYVVTNRLRRLDVPTLIFWGADDRIIPVKHAHSAARALPSADLHVFGNCGHWPHVERASDFNRLTLEFLSR